MTLHQGKWLTINVGENRRDIQEKTEETFKNEQSRDNRNNGHIRHKTKQKNTSQHRQLKIRATQTVTKIGCEPRCSRTVSCSCYL
jgi:hypothetical protein